MRSRHGPQAGPGGEPDPGSQNSGRLGKRVYNAACLGTQIGESWVETPRLRGQFSWGRQARGGYKW